MDKVLQPQQKESLEIIKDKRPWGFYELFEWFGGGLMIYQLHDQAQVVFWGLVFVLLAVYVHIRVQPQSVVIDFQQKLAVYKYPPYLYFKKEKRISLSEFTLVYLSGNTSSIHFSNRKGNQLTLIGVDGVFKIFLNLEEARDMTDQIARGLGIQSAHYI